MRLKNEDLAKAIEIKQFLEKHYQEHYDYDYLVHKFGMNKKTISLILDRKNEVKLIRNIEKEVIIVNDCSSDNTEAMIQSYISSKENHTINYFKYIKHDVNQGKGAAIQPNRFVVPQGIVTPNWDHPYNNRGYCLLLLGMVDIAYPDLQTAMENKR